MSALRDAVSQARIEIDGWVHMLESPSQEVSKAVDEALDALDKLAGVLDGESAQAFLDSHFVIIPVELPAKKHTIVGIGMTAAWPPKSIAKCSCGWETESTGNLAVGQEVAEHLVGSGHPGVEDVRKWGYRASLDFTGQWS